MFTKFFLPCFFLIFHSAHAEEINVYEPSPIVLKLRMIRNLCDLDCIDIDQLPLSVLYIERELNELKEIIIKSN